jgi:hypothetical protein
MPGLILGGAALFAAGFYAGFKFAALGMAGLVRDGTLVPGRR